MDPNGALDELRQAVTDSYNGAEVECDRVLDLIDGLDFWLSNGGFLPKAWANKRDTVVQDTNTASEGV